MSIMRQVPACSLWSRDALEYEYRGIDRSRELGQAHGDRVGQALSPVEPVAWHSIIERWFTRRRCLGRAQPKPVVHSSSPNVGTPAHTSGAQFDALRAVSAHQATLGTITGRQVQLVGRTMPPTTTRATLWCSYSLTSRTTILRLVPNIVLSLNWIAYMPLK